MGDPGPATPTGRADRRFWQSFAPTHWYPRVKSAFRSRRTRAAATLGPWARPALVGLGGLLFIGGLYLFGMVQTQALFRVSAVLDIRPGLANRNDGGILITALLAALGLSSILTGLSTLPAKKRLLPATGLTFSAATLLVAHFSFFVNGVLLPEAGQATMQASFLFHDAAVLPLAVTSLALATLVVIGIGLVSAMALVTPRLLRDRILYPTTLTEHRTRTVLATLLFVASTMPFSIQFFRYALEADQNPTGGFIATNLIALYYILAFLVLVATALVVWRSWILAGGDIRFKSSRSFRRNLRTFLNLENWLWATILLLTIVVFNSASITRPQELAVFNMDSRGASIFFLLIIGIYLLHRLVGRAFTSFLQKNRTTPTPGRPIDLFAFAIIATVIWIAVPVVLTGGEVTPLLVTLTRTALITIILLVSALRIDPMETSLIRPRNQNTPMIFFFLAALAILTGIMLWGAGNSVLTIYSRPTGGFLTPESQFLQPYTVLFRILGAAFIALPLVVGLWLLSVQGKRSIQPGHLFMIGLGSIIAVNLLFTIQPADVLDSDLGQTDVRFGFYILQITSAIDKFVMTAIWGAATMLVMYAVSKLLLRSNGMRFFPHRLKPREKAA